MAGGHRLRGGHLRGRVGHEHGVGAGAGPARIGTATTAKAGSGATVTVAYLPGDMPNYIFPMIAPASDTPADIFWFIEQFWRPLYWFGDSKGGSGFNESLSLAYPRPFPTEAGRRR